jgi:hypothetical protein
MCQAAEDCGLIGFAEREAEKQSLLSRTSELNSEKEALEQRAADLSAALAVGITTNLYVVAITSIFLGRGGKGLCYKKC